MSGASEDGATPLLAERVALIGCGLIGGSLAAALKQAGVVGAVIGCDRDPAHLEAARARGLVDSVSTNAAAAVAGADVVLLALPVRAAAALVTELGGALAGARLVSDVGSTKQSIVAAAAAQPWAARFCGAHPLAGGERSGPAAADAALFRGRPLLLTPTAATAPAAVERCAALWRAAGAVPRVVDAVAHDRLMAWVSHLPHAAAFALASAIGAVGDDAAGLWGGGFRDTTRIAASDAAMWRDIFLDNRAALLTALDGLAAELGALRAAVDAGDGEAVAELVRRAGAARRRVLGEAP